MPGLLRAAADAALKAFAEFELSTYSALRSYNGTSDTIYLYAPDNSIPGITGVFKLDDTDLTSTDNGGTVIVGANGRRWKRVFSGPLDLRWFGGVADSSFGTVGTDNSPALVAAHAALPKGGGAIHIPAYNDKLWRFASRVDFTKRVVLTGDSGHDNPGIVAGTTYTFPDTYRGTVLYFDSGVAGLRFFDCTNVDVATFLGGTNADKFKYESARRSVVRDLLLLSANNGVGTDGSLHGIESRTTIHLQNVTSLGFPGNGIRLESSTDAVDAWGHKYGNTSGSTVTGCRTRGNSGSGLYIGGRDANVITVKGHDSALNGRWGYEDNGLLGNLYLGCHAATNNQKYASFGSGEGADADQYVGAYKVSSIVAATDLLGCYVESGRGNESRGAALVEVRGGNLASVGTVVGSRNWAANETAYIELAGVASRAPRRHISKQGAKSVGVRVGNNDTGMSVLAFGDIDSDPGENYQDIKLKYNNLSNGWWAFERANAPLASSAMIPGTQAAARADAWAFPNGYYLNGPGIGGTIPLVDSGTAAPALAASTVRGDFRFNRGTTTDGILGWRAMIGGAGGVFMPVVLPGSQNGPETGADADATLTVFTNKVRHVVREPLTANRALTLSATNVFAGAEFKVTRTAASTGAFNLSVGGLKNLATGQWCVVGYNGAAWELLEFGSL